MQDVQSSSIASEGGVAGSLVPNVAHLLLDLPSEHPELGFPETARALGDIVATSSPRFAVGIFGRWGSGKSTLMQAIARRVHESDPAQERVIPVEFNAWRYEREEHLIIPLLDTLREALSEWAGRQGGDEAGEARQVASTIGRAIRSIVAGLSVSIGVPGAIDLSWEANKTLEEARTPAIPFYKRALRPDQDDEAAVPHSFYHASFRALKRALESFLGADRRVVVFVDDLDRCLPDRALQVLESMKLFFDLEGFVFVVGLDQTVVDYALWAKFHRDLPVGVLPEATAEAALPSDGEAAGSLPSSVVVAAPSGEDYVKKVFQLEYRIAPVRYEDLETFLEAALKDSKLPDAQALDIRTRVLSHLQVMVGDAPVNPREVKRYVNEYTLLMAANPALDADVVLCLSTLQRRPDWRTIHEALLEWGDAFLDALRNYGSNPRALVNLDPDLQQTPDDFLAYVTGGPAAALLNPALGSLDPYVRSGEALRSDLNPELLTAVRMLSDARATVGGALSHDPPALEIPTEALSQLDRVQATVAQFGRGPLSKALISDLANAVDKAKALTVPPVPKPGDAVAQPGSGATQPGGEAEDRVAKIKAFENQLRDITKRLLRVYRAGDRGVGGASGSA
ncbi:MAG: KAP family P-loop NTPase fold protein [Solirubrobacteraceae bacterium]